MDLLHCIDDCSIQKSLDVLFMIYLVLCGTMVVSTSSFQNVLDVIHDLFGAYDLVDGQIM